VRRIIVAVSFVPQGMREPGGRPPRLGFGGRCTSFHSLLAAALFKPGWVSGPFWPQNPKSLRLGAARINRRKAPDTLTPDLSYQVAPPGNRLGRGLLRPLPRLTLL
jgi:hypothetical protein